MNFSKKTDQSNRSNEQFLFGFIFSCKMFLAHATNSLRLGIFNLPRLREITIAFQSPRARVSG